MHDVGKARHILIFSVLITAITTFSFGWSFGRSSQRIWPRSEVGTSTDPLVGRSNYSLGNLQEVWENLRTNYYDASKLDTQKLEQGAVKGFVEGINDPYTVYMTPQEAKDFQSNLDGELQGVGIEVEFKNSQLIVARPIKNSPAERLGVKAADVILKIDGALTSAMTLTDAVYKIRGKKGTSVTLTLGREGRPEPFDIKLIRDNIVVENVTMKKLSGDIFYIEFSQFNDHAKSEFRDAVQEILLNKAKGVIIDVRGNGGGYLDTASDILSEFISGEKVVAIIKKRHGKEEQKTNGSARLADIPLVVLVDKGSASASEIFAGAIQDYRRGIVIGETTYGKGSVQELTDLKDGALLRETVAKWFTPLDRSIDQVGVTPDIVVKFTEADGKANKDPQLDAATKYLKEHPGE